MDDQRRCRRTQKEGLQGWVFGYQVSGRQGDDLDNSVTQLNSQITLTNAGAWNQAVSKAALVLSEENPYCRSKPVQSAMQRMQSKPELKVVAVDDTAAHEST